jgi:CheY-like chemotaxis protein
MARRNVILVADDSEDDLLLFRRALAKARILNPILTVPNGDEAIAYLNGDGQYTDREKFPYPILLLVDSLMPRKTGFEVLEWLRSHRHPMLGLVMLTGKTSLKDAFRAYELGAHTFLTKPIVIEDFLTLVDAIKGIQIKKTEDGDELELRERT